MLSFAIFFSLFDTVSKVFAFMMDNIYHNLECRTLVINNNLILNFRQQVATAMSIPCQSTR